MISNEDSWNASDGYNLMRGLHLLDSFSITRNKTQDHQHKWIFGKCSYNGFWKCFMQTVISDQPGKDGVRYSC